MKMKSLLAPMIAVTLAASFVGCSKRDKSATITTRETSNAREEVDKSRSDSSPVQKAEVQKAFADLDKEISELEVLLLKSEGAERAKVQYKLDALKNRRDALRK